MNSIEYEILSCSALLPLYLGEGRRRLIGIIAEKLKENYGRSLVVNVVDAIVIDMREIMDDYVVAAFIYTYINGDYVVWSTNDLSPKGVIAPKHIVVLPKNDFEDIVKSLKEISNGLIGKPKLLLSGKTRCFGSHPIECYISSYKSFVYRYDDICLQLKCTGNQLRIDTVTMADKFVSSLIDGTGKLVDSILSRLPRRGRKSFGDEVKEEITSQALRYLSQMVKKYMIVFPKTPEYMELFKIS